MRVALRPLRKGNLRLAWGRTEEVLTKITQQINSKKDILSSGVRSEKISNSEKIIQE
jgi:hypothetical protein